MRIEHGDMREVLARLIAEGVTVQSIVTDPPYGLAFMGKAWDAADNVAFQAETWRLCYELLPPGGHLLAFSGTRTYHRMACAIEDAGFEIRDMVSWIYGSGFPKSHNVSKGIDKAAGVAFTASPASGVGFMGPDGPGGYNVTKNRLDRAGDTTAAARQWEGWGTALKPALEPICLARKPLVGTVAQTVLAHGTGALNIDSCRVEGIVQAGAGSTGFGQRDDGYQLGTGRQYMAGRWPANVVHDGSDEVVGAFPDGGATGGTNKAGGCKFFMGGDKRESAIVRPNDSGSAARFFYSAKAGKADRCGSKHPTVKPVKLLRWLVRLITPPGGTVLDPFAGSGTTGAACEAEGLGCILVEREAEYVADIRRRLAHVSGDDTPLFAHA